MPDQVNYNENELIEQLLARSRDGFNYLYEHYSGAIYSAILQFIPDRELAADLLQEVFLKIWKQIESYDRGKGRLYTWMLQIARNSAIDVVRTKKYQAQQKNQELSGAVYEIGTMDLNPDKIGLRDHIGQLKPEYQQVLDLSYFQGFTQEEMSERLGIPLGTVKTRIRAALIQLRKIYKT
ncbi:MAG TPA: sigma-70 family RNA polymerase sigma factor [Phnomibacter sp.]|nr:sigma-70 family RNA polymerase sigma factor [Phnomibacter sp.]